MYSLSLHLLSSYWFVHWTFLKFSVSLSIKMVDRFENEASYNFWCQWLILLTAMTHTVTVKLIGNYRNCTIYTQIFRALEFHKYCTEKFDKIASIAIVNNWVGFLCHLLTNSEQTNMHTLSANIICKFHFC